MLGVRASHPTEQEMRFCLLSLLATYKAAKDRGGIRRALSAILCALGGQNARTEKTCVGRKMAASDANRTQIGRKMCGVTLAPSCAV
jgi:hypothetical protein